MAKLGGKVFLIDRNDINTDEIIPAKYLTEVDKKIIAQYLLEDLKLEGFSPKSPELKTSKVIVSRENFGCGSSREHAVWVFTENGYQVVIAENFARIFRQNAYNNGLLAIELSKDKINQIFDAVKSDPKAEIQVDIEAQAIEVKSQKGNSNLTFEISPFYKDVVKSGGWIHYVQEKY